MKKSLYQGILAMLWSSRRASKRGWMVLFVRGCRTFPNSCGGCYLGLLIFDSVRFSNFCLSKSWRGSDYVSCLREDLLGRL